MLSAFLICTSCHSIVYSLSLSASIIHCSYYPIYELTNTAQIVIPAEVFHTKLKALLFPKSYPPLPLTIHIASILNTSRYSCCLTVYLTTDCWTLTWNRA